MTKVFLPLVLAVMAAATQAEPANNSTLKTHSCHIKGVSEPLRCARVQVPAHYDKTDTASNTAMLDLHITIAPAIRENAAPDPLFILAGGPGQAGTDVLPLMDRAFKKIRQNRDLVFIDQRGTGRSGKLVCKDYEHIGDLPLPEQEAAMDACLLAIEGDKSAYTTENSAHDLDRIRIALGYEQINIWGGSYGTRLGQTYARLFEGKTRSLILDSVAAPEQILGIWGQDAQHSLDAMFAHCAADSACKQAFPDLEMQWSEVQERVAHSDFQIDMVHPRTGVKSREFLSYRAFSETVRTALYGSESSALLPLAITRAHGHDWQPFVQMAYASSDWSTQSMAFGMTLSVVCAEDMPLLTEAIKVQEMSASFLRGGVVADWPRYCSLMKIAPVKTVALSAIERPVLLLSGALDPVTPPHRADSAMKHMSKAQHLIAKNVGHIVSHQGCAPKLLKDFIDKPDDKLDGKCLDEVALPPFSIGNIGSAP